MTNTTDFKPVIQSEWMDTGAFLELPEVFCQRDTEMRVRKSKLRLGSLMPEHAVVTVAVLTKEDELDGIKYPAGSVWRVDGNSRSELWKQGQTDSIPEQVYVIKYRFDTLERIQECYWTFDSIDATESTGEAFYGILKTLGYVPYTSKVKKGSIQTALAFAHKNFYVEQDFSAKVKRELQEMTSRFLPEIKSFDKVVCQNMDSWDQALVCLALYALRKYGSENERAMEGLQRIDTKYSISAIGVEVDGISKIVEEWKKPKDQRQIPSGTKWSDFGQQIDFLTYCFDKWMNNETFKVYKPIRNYHKRWGIHND